MVRSTLTRLQTRIGALGDWPAILFTSILSIGGLVGLFVAARLVIDWLEVWLQ